MINQAETGNKRNKGFTLAEVLITLSIIGVVAALTIPALTKSYEKMQFNAAFKKEYSTISQATLMIAADNSGTLDGKFSYLNFQTQFCQYLKCVKTCSNSANTPCWHADGETYQLNGTQTNRAVQGAAILKDGARAAFYDMMSLSDRACNKTAGSYHNACGFVLIDVNGSKGPNTYGKDIFSIYILSDRVVPGGADALGAAWPQFCTDGTGFGCAVKVLQNIDYY
jgi:prepilin-type N-terminal cleavage/methylation domain-containing protein